MNTTHPVRAFFAAWELLLDLRVPDKLRRRYPPEKADPRLTLLAVPAVGFAVAVVVLLAGTLLRHTFLFSENGAAILFALAVTILLDAKDSGRGVSLLIAVVAMLFRKIPLLPSLPQLRSPNLGSLSGAVPVAALVLLEMFKLGMWFLTFRAHAEAYLLVVVVLSFSLQGTLMTLPNLEDRAPFLDVPAPLQNQVWPVAVFLVLFVGIFLPLATLIATGATILFALVARNLCDRLYGGVTADLVTLAGAANELLLLFLGVIILG